MAARKKSSKKPAPSSVTGAMPVLSGSEFQEVLKAIKAELPRADRKHLEACLMPGIHATIQPVLAKVEEMLRLEREPRPFSHKGTALRALLTPNRLKPPKKGKTSRIPKRASARGREYLVCLEPRWHGKDFMILNPKAGTFRAWSADFHRPRASRIDEAPPAAREFLEEILSEELPDRDLGTALVRLSLAPRVRVRDKLWIDLAEPPFEWLDSWRWSGLVLPQAYVHSAIQHLGSRFGLDVLVHPDLRLEVTWNGTVFAMREIIDSKHWIKS